MKKLFPLFIAAILFTGCEKIEGQLNVTKDLKLRNSDGVVKTLAVGTYTADIKANTSKKITLRLNSDNNQKYVMNVPDGSLPSNGSFAYKSDVVGQPVDVAGTVATAVKDSDRQRTTQTCTYQRAVQYCFPVPGGGMSCGVRYETAFGQQWITFFDRTTNKNVNLSIAAAGVAEESAQFQGEATWTDRMIVSQSQCM
jgi:hypothetical protein